MSAPLHVIAVTIDGTEHQIPQPPARFWHREAGTVVCDLCYRRCQLAPGDVGWCKVRENLDGELALSSYGIMSTLNRFNGSGYWQFRQDSPALYVGGISCTSGCSFCTSTHIALAPDRLPWLYPDNPARTPPRNQGWSFHLAYVTPEAAVERALGAKVDGFYIGANESLLQAEWTIEAFRLAKEAGLWTSMDTNGFSDPAVIAECAPYLDYCYLGAKGSMHEGFYAKHMRAPGAVPHVLRSIETWRDAPNTLLSISDVIAPFHWVDDDEFERQTSWFYQWIASEIGPLTPVEVRAMGRPLTPDRYTAFMTDGLLAPEGQQERAWQRAERALEIAREAGLKYAYPFTPEKIYCHSCGGELRASGKRYGQPSYITDQHCDHCGAWVPIVG